MKKFRELSEQHREKGRFKPTVPHNVSNTPGGTPRETSDSANVKLREAIKDKYDIGEYDQEGDMAKSDLRSIIANSKRVHDMLEDDDNLPEWVQSKITKAEDYMSTVANYMEAEMNEEFVTEESVPASKALQKAHEDERKRRGLPDPSYYLELMKKKKKEIEDMKKKEVDESIASTVGGLVGQYAGSKIGMEGPGKEHGALAGRMIDYHARKFLKKVKNKITGQKNESVELDEGKYGGFRVGPKRPKYPYVPQGNSDPRTGLPLGFSNPPKSEKPEDKKMKKEEVELLDEKNKPTNPELWGRAKALAKQKFDVYPSAYANGWAAKWYKSKGGGWRSVSEDVDLEEGYFKNQEIERQETERLAKRNEPPFKADKPKKPSVVVGKKPEGYSRARQLARRAIPKPVKEAKEMSRKAKIVKDAMKKNDSEDKFQARPELGDSVTRNL